MPFSLSLVRSRLTYCSQVWRPSLIKDICLLEQIQRRRTKYILNDYQSDYKSRLISLNILPLMYTYELLDILFLVHSLKQPDPCLPINDYISFSSSSTRVGHTLKLVHRHSLTSLSSHSYFKRVARLWNALPPIDLNCSLPTIKFHLKQFLWNHFIDNFNPDLPCTYHFFMSLPQVCSDASVSEFYIYSSLVFYLFFNTPDTSSTYWRSFSTTNYNFDYHLIHFIYIHSSCLY